MLLRRIVPRYSYPRFVRTFSEIPSTENPQPHQPKPQTISVDSVDQPETADQKEIEEKKAKNEEKLKGISEYKEALQFYQQGRYRMSDDKFKRVLGQLEATERGSENHIHVLKKLVSNQLMLRRYQDADEYLDEIVDTVQNYSSNEPLIYAQYNNLFLHRLKTNINKAILMGKALLSDTERPNLPLIYQKQFEFNLGTAYLLKGNYVDAKSRLRECLSLKPNTLLKGYALNNLAVASWWHKFPNFTTLPDSDDDEGGLDSASGYTETDREYTYRQIDEDFANVIPLFKNSLFNIENVEGIKDPERKKYLEELFDQGSVVPKDYKKRNPDSNWILNTKSGIPLLNLGEFLFNTAPEKRNEATFWFKYALKFFEKNDPSNIDRCLITLALFCASSKQYVKAEGLFRRALEMLENSDSYNKILCLQLYSQMLAKMQGRQKEADKLRSEAYSLADQMPFWSNKIVHVCIPDMEL